MTDFSFLQKKSVRTIKNLRGKRVLLRLDLNVPLRGERVQDDSRLEAVRPMVEYLIKKEARVIIVSHLGSDGSASLAPVARRLAKLFPLTFCPSWADLSALATLENGQVVLLENIRRQSGELENTPAFGRQLAELADVYVNEAFSVSHREQASIVAVTKFLPSYFGLRFEQECLNLAKALSPAHPFLFILGGAKYTTKVPLLKKFLPLADLIFIGGALANSFFKKLGYETGLSVVDQELTGISTFLKNKKLILPADVVVETGGVATVKEPASVTVGDMIVDTGPDTVEALLPLISQASLVLWNGPLGYFEKGFSRATLKVAKAVAASSAFTIVGGGDTLSAISHLKLATQISFTSTAGGAMLDFLAQGTLPGIEAIRKNRKE